MNMFEAISELRRELEIRKIVYPRMVQTGKLTKRATDERMARLEYAVECLEVCIDLGMTECSALSDTLQKVLAGRIVKAGEQPVHNPRNDA